MIFAAFLYVSAKAQETTSTPTAPFPPLAPFGPTPTLNPYTGVFPGFLHCDQINGVSEGASWGNVTVGVSSVEDLKSYVATIYDYDVFQASDYIGFSKKGNQREMNGIPDVIDACLDVATQKVTALRVWMNRVMVIQDLVAIYGIPDVVTWDISSRYRTAFWFDKGIATLVNILEDDKELQYGQFDAVVYLPYQSKDGFENRWPYNQTSPEYFDSGVYNPTPSKERNPFDFQAMSATIAAEPLRTPTPTFAPFIPTATATP